MRHNTSAEISSAKEETVETYAPLGYQAAHSGNSLPMFRINISVPIFKGQEIQSLQDRTDGLSRNVDKELTHYVAQTSRRAQISSASRR